MSKYILSIDGDAVTIERIETPLARVTPPVTTGNAPPGTFKIAPVESPVYNPKTFTSDWGPFPSERKAQPAVKRVPVRLWVHHDCRSDERYNVFVKLTPPGESNLYREILHNENGFYVEATQ